MEREIPTIAKTYLKFLFNEEYAGKLEHDTTGEILDELEGMGLIVEGVINIPDSVWEEILATTD